MWLIFFQNVTNFYFGNLLCLLCQLLSSLRTGNKGYTTPFGQANVEKYSSTNASSCRQQLKANIHICTCSYCMVCSGCMACSSYCIPSSQIGEQVIFWCNVTVFDNQTVFDYSHKVKGCSDDTISFIQLVIWSKFYCLYSLFPLFHTTLALFTKPIWSGLILIGLDQSPTKAGPAHVQGPGSDRIWSGTRSGYVNAPCSSDQTKSLTSGGKSQSSNKNGELATWCKLVNRWKLDYYKNLEFIIWSLIFEGKMINPALLEHCCSQKS